MRHLTPHYVDGRWRYASLSRRGGGPLGLCNTDDGHATETEARECYAGYQRSRVRLDSTLADWTGCVAGEPKCDKPTKKIADIEGEGFASAPLCDEHLTVEEAIKALGLDQPAGDSWVS